jgi:tetratricopeptide (TPR) repeat protein
MKMQPAVHVPFTNSPRDVSRWLDGLLVASMVAAASVLACQELRDSDAWWHLRSGQWILENRRLPTLDPFTFASADREWIDLHWGFQVPLALVYRLGGVAGMILLAAAMCGVTLLIAMTARMRDWPAWVVAAAWIPALLVMSSRLPPRPEIFSLVFLAAYMAVLLRCDQRPALAWALPAIQVVWVNSHGLFILGPLILGAYIVDGVLGTLRHCQAAGAPANCTGPRWWMHVVLASITVGAACLVNPYGVRGALFPLELFAKIGPQGGIYKANIGEFGYPSVFLQDVWGTIAMRNLLGRGEFFLLLMLPTSFLVPAIWAIWSKAVRRDRLTRCAFASRWLFGMVIVAGLTIFAPYSIPLASTPAWRVQSGRWAPAGFLALGLVAAAVMIRRSPLAALLSTCGAVAVAGGLSWLAAALLGNKPGAASPFDIGPIGWPWVSGTAAAVSLFLTLHAGGRLFRILLAVAFGYLALQAMRNVNIFGVMAGFVLASELGEWAAKVSAGRMGTADPRQEWWGLATRGVMAALIMMGTVAAATGRLTAAHGWPWAFGLRETPSMFAHDAARFAARQGMPIRCLAFNLAQSSVYLYHNSPERKLFMDPRLEVATKSTFETYVWLRKAMNEGRSGWSGLVEQMGNPTILLDHTRDFGAEATLLADPRWRCVYFDAVASVFLASNRKDLEAWYPTIDFAARHFLPRQGDHTARGLDEAFGESNGLFRMGYSLQTKGALLGTQRLPILLLAAARARESLAISSSEGRGWLALGSALWSLSEELTSHQPAGPAEAWDPARGLAGAQAMYAFRRTVALEPVAGEVLAALRAMKTDYHSRGMIDARDWAEELSNQFTPMTALPEAQPRSTRAVEKESIPAGTGSFELSELFEDRLRYGRPLAAIELARRAEARGIALSWELADRAATTYLHLGEPAEGRRYWERAQAPRSPALRLARIAQSELALTDLEAAEKTFRAALGLDHRLGEAWFGLALLELQLGDADATMAACHAGMSCTLTEPQREVLDKFKTLVDRFTSSERGSGRASP